jgi:hypothetical protein
MRIAWVIAVSLATAGSALQAQRIVEVPASQANVTRPEDLYQLEPGRWHLARQLWTGDEACTATECEAGFTQGDLVVSAYHTMDKVFIIAAWRSCASPAFSELDIGDKVSSGERRKVGKQVERVLRGLEKTCKITAPTVPALAGDWLFPAATPVAAQGAGPSLTATPPR